MVLGGRVSLGGAQKPPIKTGPFWCAASAFMAASFGAFPAAAQTESESWVLSLPRPGYDAHQLQLGPATVDVSVTAETAYQSNIFATPTNEVDDFVFQIRPDVSAEIEQDGNVFALRAYGAIRRFAENGQEDTNAYGARGSARIMMNRSNTLTASGGYDRSYDRRDDPEASLAAADPLTEVDIVLADLAHELRRGRFGLITGAGFQQADYLSATEDDRDLATLRVSTRALLEVFNAVDLFTEGYGTFRNARLPVDRNGVDRDAKAYGVRTGLAIDLTDTLNGDVGVGVFRAELEDPVLEDFTGLSASGQLRWSPWPRTGVIFDVFRGDVATVRSGASGRIDFQLGLEVIQEIRHDLRGRASVNYVKRRFRSASSEMERDIILRAGGDYLFNRHVALQFYYQVKNRDSTRIGDDFDAHALGLALELQY